MRNTLSKLKYCAMAFRPASLRDAPRTLIAASVALLLTLGITVVRGAITGGGVKSWAAGIILILSGSLLQVASIKGLYEIISVEEDEEEERILQQLRRQEIPKPCRGCRNFHGGRYGGVMLVCGIHPEGVKEDHCPDYEVFKGGKVLDK